MSDKFPTDPQITKAKDALKAVDVQSAAEVPMNSMDEAITELEAVRTLLRNAKRIRHGLTGDARTNFMAKWFDCADAIDEALKILLQFEEEPPPV